MKLTVYNYWPNPIATRRDLVTTLKLHGIAYTTEATDLGIVYEISDNDWRHIQLGEHLE